MTLLQILGFAVSGILVLIGLSILRERRTASRAEAALWAVAPQAAPPELFRSARVAEMPAPASRYLVWSIAEGTPLCNAIRLRMTGRIRLGRERPWMPLDCEEVLRQSAGFLWKARTRGAFSISGFDRYVEGEGEMRWRMWGLIPVMRAHGPEITRSALGRFAAERFLVPASLLPGPDVAWREIDRFTAGLRILEGGVWHDIELSVDADGMPRKIVLPRWGNFETPDGKWQQIPYAVRFEGVVRSGGYTLPHSIRASWWAGTERELGVVELEIDEAEFRDGRPCEDGVAYAKAS